MNNETKYQVFISSTYTDLVQARSAVINTVLESYNFPVGMELFGADNDEQWKIIKELIDSSDFYILILGHRYGSISKDEGISFTEKEFDYAVNKGLKLLCFVRNENVATHPYERDSNNENVEKLKEFRKKVLADRLCEFWDSVDDLKHKISSSLYKNMRKHGGVGWVRGNQVSGQLAEEIGRLSEENRKLREENEQLKHSISLKKPILKVSLNNINNIDYNKDEYLEIFWHKLREDEYYERPEKKQKNFGFNKLENLSSGSLIIGLSAENYIEIYNDDLDRITDNVIKQHNHALRDYYQIENGHNNLAIDVSNIGKVIASKVSIKIEFPPFVLLVDDNSSENLEFYKNELNKMIIGHIAIPEKRSKNYLLPNIFGGRHGSYIPKFPLDHPFKKLMPTTLIIELGSLLHSRNIFENNYYILPKSIGDGFIKVNIMCSEYDEPILFEIPIQVIE
ncbi:MULTISPECIES: DUF4062 domain-containing protein [Acinetobacter]|uniref:DUF4062 domain-containing protein n=1 Tax=Acinetobacter TaxID=469 RepID=UPI000CFEAE4D|nr:DUF4062 domain-containing protein [Acinetobacter sp. MYb10]QLD63054.1 DUF4062 domain-containing protein [Acinetobacter sp. MYb10]